MAMYRGEIEDILMNFNSTVSEIKNNRYMSANLDFETGSFSVKIGDDIEAFIKKYIVGKTFTAQLEFGMNDKTITITRDMVTYNGSTDYDGMIEIFINYYDELYQSSAPGMWIQVQVYSVDFSL